MQAILGQNGQKWDFVSLHGSKHTLTLDQKDEALLGNIKLMKFQALSEDIFSTFTKSIKGTRLIKITYIYVVKP